VTSRRRGGRGDTVAPLVALAIVVLISWFGVRTLRNVGWDIPWSPLSSRAVEPRIAPDRDAAAARRADETTNLPRADKPAGQQTGAAATMSAPGRRPETPIVTTSDDVDMLRARRLDLPVPNIARDHLQSNFHDARGGALHEAIDILAARGDPVVAVEEGTIAKLFTSAKGGLTVYQFDPSGTYCYYYAHLDRYAEGLHDGDTVRRGQVIGYVGTTGNAPPGTPHLHFSIFKLGPDRRWWQGEAIDPYLVFR
jgi:murein DD-endopeptidase MepM/ murein hydrolase activator NlpD